MFLHPTLSKTYEQILKADFFLERKEVLFSLQEKRSFNNNKPATMTMIYPLDDYSEEIRGCFRYPENWELLALHIARHCFGVNLPAGNEALRFVDKILVELIIRG